MLKKVLVVLMMITISLGTLGGCKKSNEDKAKDVADDVKDVAEDAADDAKDMLE